MRVALAQMRSTRDVAQNLDVCRRLGEHAAREGAGWVVFPENAPFLGQDDDKLAVAESVDGAMVGVFRELARAQDIWVTVGSFPERTARGDRTSNTLVTIAPDGSLAAVYRKIHLFDVDLGEGLGYRESAWVEPGEDLKLVDVGAESAAAGGGFRVGLSICYDLRFPELYRALALQGAEVLVVPAAFTKTTGEAHWHTLLRARAIENQCYVLAPNQWGVHFGQKASFGNSVIYDPWGRCLGNLEEGDGVVVADLDRAVLEDVRRKIPCLTHRRL